jgi:competence protein ComEC
MTYKDVSFLFTGDIEEHTELELLNKDIKADVLKVSHHGSNTSSNDKFLDKVNPKYGIIMCGVNNDYYHPHKKILDRLSRHNIEVHRTDLEGTIIFSTDGKNITESSIKTNINVEDD